MESGPLLSGSSVREVVVVVLSILIAFALDAGWDRLSETRDLREQMKLVQGEFQDTADALGFGVQAHSAQSARAAEIRRLLEAAGPGAVVEVSDTLVGPLFPQFTADVSTAVLQSFLDAGGLELIDDADLRARVRQWPVQLEDLADDERHLRAFVDTEMGPFLRRNFEVARAITIAPQFMSRRAQLGLAERDSVFGSVPLANSFELVNLVTARALMENGVAGTVREALEEAAAIAEGLARR